jgi:hypothetical protein
LEVEIKVREILNEFLQPFIKKQNEDTTKLNELKKSFTNVQRKIDDHDFLLSK